MMNLYRHNSKYFKNMYITEVRVSAYGAMMPHDYIGRQVEELLMRELNSPMTHPHLHSHNQPVIIIINKIDSSAMLMTSDRMCDGTCERMKQDYLAGKQSTPVTDKKIKSKANDDLLLLT